MWDGFNWQLQRQVAFFDKSIIFLIGNRIFGARFGDCNLIFSIYAHNICCHYVCMICQSKQLSSTRYSSFSFSFSLLSSPYPCKPKRRKERKRKVPLSIYIAFGFSLAAKTLKTTNERHLQVAPAPAPSLQLQLLLLLQLQLACGASSSCLHLLSDFFAAVVVVVAAIHTPKLLLPHECCKSKVGESHEGSADCDCDCGSSSGSGSRVGTKRSLFDWQAERITLAIIALVLHEQRKQQRRHHVTSAPSSFSPLPPCHLFIVCWHLFVHCNC